MASTDFNPTDINNIDENDENQALEKSSEPILKNRKNLLLLVLGVFLLFVLMIGVGVAIVLKDSIKYGIKDKI